ncbi:MAG: DUF2800 domain-containing protein [Schwartzia succinivorans]|nr:DUF2800 domain-containing protein [Schwartzia succinivorans]
MASKAHAVLSASSAHRWLFCTPSARLEQDFEDTSSEAAAEGTAAHALAEHKLKRVLKRRSKRPTSPYDSDEMEDHTDSYVAFVQEQLAEVKGHCRDPIVLIEQRLDLSAYAPESFGTADCIIAGDGTVHVIDFKYGTGIIVDADHNPQMMLYALGALRLFDSLYTINTVAMSIYQPRRENVSTWTLSVAELMTWAEDELRPRAKQAFDGEGEYCAGTWCVFCRAAVRCRARAAEKMKLAQQEFPLPPLLTDEEIAGVLHQLPDLVKWANEIMAYATGEAVSHGKEWPGFKLVEGRSIRRYISEEDVAKAAKDAGYTDIYEHKIISITAMEKLMGKKKFQDILGRLVTKPPGKPTLVADTDKRPAISTSAAEDFKDN